MIPVVSVVIITYNHVHSIGQCVESALMQKTSFPFEILIGEDCSTDGTREKVYDYSTRYPEIIRVIASETNVGEIENERRAFSAARGEYVAFVEGDDYWIDPLKLQKQYDAIKKFAAGLVTHNHIVVTMKGAEITGANKKFSNLASGFLEPEDIITRKFNFHLSSIFAMADLVKNLPAWYYNSPVDDAAFQLFAAYYGKIYYLDEIMSIYNHGVGNSWSDKHEMMIINKDPEINKFIRDYLLLFKNFNLYSDKKYDRAVLDHSESFLRKYIFNHHIYEFLDVSPRDKKLLRVVIPFIKFLPRKQQYTLQNKILRNIVRSIY